MHRAVPVWVDGSGPGDHFDLVVLFLRQLDRKGSKILPELLLVPSPQYDRPNTRAIFNPGQRDLRNRGIMLEGHILEGIDHTIEPFITHHPGLFPTFSTLPRPWSRFLIAVYLTGENPLPEWAPDHRTNSEFLAGGQQFIFGLARLCSVVELMADRRDESC